MKQIMIAIVFVLMFSWAVYEFFVPKENDSSMENSSDSISVSASNSDDNLDNDPVINDDEVEENAPFTDAIIGLEIGNIAPDFTLSTLEGEEVSLSGFLGQRVMINFWATWCPPCRAEMPDMEKFHLNEDVVILAINLTETEPSIQQVQDFVDEFNLTFPILLDETITVATTYEIRPIPTSLLVDSNGIIQNKAFGALTYDLMVAEFEKMQ